MKEIGIFTLVFLGLGGFISGMGLGEAASLSIQEGNNVLYVAELQNTGLAQSVSLDFKNPSPNSVKKVFFLIDNKNGGAEILGPSTAREPFGTILKTSLPWYTSEPVLLDLKDGNGNIYKFGKVPKNNLKSDILKKITESSEYNVLGKPSFNLLNFHGSPQNVYLMVLIGNDLYVIKKEDVRLEFYPGENEYFFKLFNQINTGSLNSTTLKDYEYFSFALMKKIWDSSLVSSAARQYFGSDMSEEIQKYQTKMDLDSISLEKNKASLKFALSLRLFRKAFKNGIADIDPSYLFAVLYTPRHNPYFWTALSILDQKSLSPVQVDTLRFATPYIPSGKGLQEIDSTEGKEIAQWAMRFLTDGLDPSAVSFKNWRLASTVIPSKWDLNNYESYKNLDSNYRNGAQLSSSILMGLDQEILALSDDLSSITRIDLESAAKVSWPSGLFVKLNNQDYSGTSFLNDKKIKINNDGTNTTINTKSMTLVGYNFQTPWIGLDISNDNVWKSMTISLNAKVKYSSANIPVISAIYKESLPFTVRGDKKIFINLNKQELEDRLRSYFLKNGATYQELADNQIKIEGNVSQNLSEISFYTEDPTLTEITQTLISSFSTEKKSFTLFKPLTVTEKNYILAHDGVQKRNTKTLSLRSKLLSGYTNPSLLIWTELGNPIPITVTLEGGTPQALLTALSSQQNTNYWDPQRLNGLKISGLDFGTPLSYLKTGVDYPGIYNQKVISTWDFRFSMLKQASSTAKDQPLSSALTAIENIIPDSNGNFTANDLYQLWVTGRKLLDTPFQAVYYGPLSELVIVPNTHKQLSQGLQYKPDLNVSTLYTGYSGRPYLFSRLTGTSHDLVDKNSPYQTSKRAGVDGLGLLSGVLSLTMPVKLDGNNVRYKSVFDTYSTSTTSASTVAERRRKHWNTWMSELSNFQYSWESWVSKSTSSSEPSWYHNGDGTKSNLSWKQWDLEAYSKVITDLKTLRIGDLLVGRESVAADEGDLQIGVIAGFLSPWPPTESDPEKIWNQVIVVGAKQDTDRVSLGTWGGVDGQYGGFTRYPNRYVPRRLLKIDSPNSQSDLDSHPFVGPAVEGYVFYPETPEPGSLTMWPFVPNTGEPVTIGRMHAQVKVNETTLLDIPAGTSIGNVLLTGALDWAYQNEDGSVKTGDKYTEAVSGNIYKNKGHNLILIAYQSDSKEKQDTLKEYGIPLEVRAGEFMLQGKPAIKVADLTVREGKENLTPVSGLRYSIESGILKVNNKYDTWAILAQSDNGVGPYPGDDIQLLWTVKGLGASFNRGKQDPTPLRLAIYDKKMLWRANLYIDEQDESDWNDVHPWVTGNEWNKTQDGTVVDVTYAIAQGQRGIKVVPGGQNITPYDATWQNNLQKTGSMLYSRGSIDTPFSFNRKMREYALRAFQVQNGLVIAPTDDQLKALMKPSTWLGYLTQVMAKDFKINSEADYWTIKEWINTTRESQATSIPAWSSWVWYKQDGTFNMMSPYIQVKIDGYWVGVGELAKKYNPLAGINDDLLVWRLFREFPGDLDRKAQFEQDIRTKFIDVVKHYASLNVGHESLVEEDQFEQPDPEKNIITSYTLNGTEYRAVWYYGDTGADDTQGIGVDCVGFWHQAAGWDNNPYLLADLKDGYEFGTYGVDKQSQDRYGLLWGTYGPPNAAKWPVSKNSPVSMPNNYQIAAKTNTDAELKERLNLVVPGDVLYYGLGVNYSHTMIVGGVDGVINDVSPASKDFEKIMIIEATLPQVLSGYIKGGNSLKYYHDLGKIWAFGRLRNKI